MGKRPHALLLAMIFLLTGLVTFRVLLLPLDIVEAVAPDIQGLMPAILLDCYVLFALFVTISVHVRMWKKMRT